MAGQRPAVERPPRLTPGLSTPKVRICAPVMTIFGAVQLVASATASPTAAATDVAITIFRRDHLMAPTSSGWEVPV